MLLAIVIIVIMQITITSLIYWCYLTKQKEEKMEKKEIKNIYNEVLINLYSQYSKAIDDLNLEKASFLLYNIRIVKFGNDKNNKKENKDV